MIVGPRDKESSSASVLVPHVIAPHEDHEKMLTRRDNGDSAESSSPPRPASE